MLGHGHFFLGDSDRPLIDRSRDEAAGEAALGFGDPSRRASLFSLARSGVDSSDVLLETRRDFVERVEAGLELGVAVEIKFGLSMAPCSPIFGGCKRTSATSR